MTDRIVASQRAQAVLENSLVSRKGVYMITGLKIASGIVQSSTKETQHGPRLMVTANLAPVIGAPVEAGPGLDIAIANTRTVGHGWTVNKIVSTYRVIRIKLKWYGVAKYTYKSGGKYATDDSEDSDEDEEDRWDLELLDGGDILTDFPDSARVEVE